MGRVFAFFLMLWCNTSGKLAVACFYAKKQIRLNVIKYILRRQFRYFYLKIFGLLNLPYGLRVKLK